MKPKTPKKKKGGLIPGSRSLERVVRSRRKTVASEIYRNFMSRTQEFPAGGIIHINGIPFWNDTAVKISGHRRNFIAAGLLSEGKDSAI